MIDCLNHDLLTAKFNAFGFILPAIKLIHDYLLNRKNKNKQCIPYMAGNYFWVPQCSILYSPFCSVCPLQNFSLLLLDDNTSYATTNDVDSLIVSLEETSNYFCIWFDRNPMKSNTNKCHLLDSLMK